MIYGIETYTAQNQRDRQEDRFAVYAALVPYHLQIAVVDGMGGHADGDKAAEEVAAMLPLNYEPKDLADHFKMANDQMVHRIFGRMPRFSEGTRRGAAAVFLFVGLQNEARIVWVGDCRAFLWRQNTLSDLTYDHTAMGQAFRDGKLATAEKLMVYDTSGVPLASCFGMPRDIAVGVAPLTLEKGDTILLVTDGVYGYETFRQEVRELLADGKGAEAIVKAAMRATTDNATAVLVRCR